MSHLNRIFTWGWAGLALVSLCGCYNTSLPEKLSVPLPAARSVIADADTGPFSLAGTHWRMYGTLALDQSTGDVITDNGGEAWLIGDIAFGGDGEVISVALGDVYVRDISIRGLLGELLYADAVQHMAATPETSYFAESYGENDGDMLGITILLRYFIGPLEVFTSSISVPGMLSEDRHRMDGTMTFSLSFDTDVWEVDPPAADSVAIEFYAERQ